MPTFEKLDFKASNLKLKPRNRVYAIPGVDYLKMVQRIESFAGGLDTSGIVTNNNDDINFIDNEICNGDGIDTGITNINITNTNITNITNIGIPEESQDISIIHSEPVPKKLILKSKRLSDLFLSTVGDDDLTDITSFLEFDTDLLTLARISDSD